MSNKKFPIIHTDQNKLFTIVEKSKNEVVLCVGNQMTTEKVFKSIDECKKFMKAKPWELLCNVMCIIAEKVTDSKLRDYETNKTNNAESN